MRFSACKSQVCVLRPSFDIAQIFDMSVSTHAGRPLVDAMPARPKKNMERAPQMFSPRVDRALGRA